MYLSLDIDSIGSAGEWSLRADLKILYPMAWATLVSAS